MRTDDNEALSSLLEVAAFAWSVLELLLTHILPLAGFLTGQFLLHLCRLLASFVHGAVRRFNLSHQNIAQTDHFPEEDKWLQVDAYDDLTDDSEWLKLTNNGGVKLDQGRQLIATAGEDSVKSPSLIRDNDSVDVQQAAAATMLPVDASPVYQYVDGDNPETLHEEERMEGKYVSDAGAVKTVQNRGDDQALVGKKGPFEAAASEDVLVQTELSDNDQLAHASEEGSLIDTATIDHPDSIDQGQDAVVISAEKEGLDLDGNEPGIIGGVDQQLQRSNASGSSAEAVSAPAAAEISMVGPFNSSTAGGADQQQQMMRRSTRRRGRRVLLPSLSQIKRTLKQRSGRPSTTSPSPAPAGGAGSKLSSSTGPATPSPLKKELNGSPRDWKLASSRVPSYDSFLGKFRKHFLLDRA